MYDSSEINNRTNFNLEDSVLTVVGSNLKSQYMHQMMNNFNQSDIQNVLDNLSLRNNVVHTKSQLTSYSGVRLDDVCSIGATNRSKCVQGGSSVNVSNDIANNGNDDTLRYTTKTTDNTALENVVNNANTRQVRPDVHMSHLIISLAVGVKT